MSVVIATKTLRTTILYSFLANGGEIKFKDYNFGLAIAGEGDYRELKLTIIPQHEKFTGKIVVGKRKVKKPTLTITEDKEEEL